MPGEKMGVKEKIVAISNELRVGKDGKNAFQGYEYFRPDDIAKAVNPLLEKYGILISFSMPFSAESQMYQCTLTIENTENEEKVTYRYDTPLTEVKGSSKAQGAGATMTYSKRYMIQNAFNLAENEADLDSKEHPAPAPRMVSTPKMGTPKPFVPAQKPKVTPVATDDIPVIEEYTSTTCKVCGAPTEYKESKKGAKKEWRGMFCTVNADGKCPVQWLPKSLSEEELIDNEKNYPPPEYGG